MSEKMAFEAAGDARSSSPGRIEKIVENQIARSGVWVMGELYPK